MIYFATGLTQNYLPFAAQLLDDLREKCNVQPLLFLVDFKDKPAGWISGHAVSVDYSKSTVKLPKWMLQHGGFLEFKDFCDDDIIIFADADARLQRPFDASELELFNSLVDGDICIGRNRPEGTQTLEHEARCLSPIVPLDQLEAMFPGHASLSCRNTGFVVAGADTWEVLRSKFCAMADAAVRSFANPALVQWLMCYVIGTNPFFRLLDLPLSIHAHGHLGLAPGVYKGPLGWMHEDKLIAYAHRLC